MKQQMRFIGLIAGIALIGFEAAATTVGGQGEPQAQECVLLMATRDPNTTLRETLRADLSQKIHAQKYASYSRGDYRVDILANDSWMSLVWTRGKEELGRSLMGFAGPSPNARVLLVPNSHDSSEQVSLTCYTPQK